MRGETESSTGRKYPDVDVLVHEFCKLFGKHGVPEYTSAVTAFPDFLHLMMADEKLCGADSDYYHSCASVKLERQIGNRYNCSKCMQGFVLEACRHSVFKIQWKGNIGE